VEAGPGQAMHARRWNDDESGFTLVELMVVLITIGVLATIAIPTFLTAKERAMDRAAPADLEVALSTTKAVFTDTADLTGIVVADMQTAEPTLGWVDAATASALANEFGVSFSVVGGGQVNVARLSESGVCFYLRSIESQGLAPADSVNVYKGRGVGTCSGNTVAALPTVALYFDGWELHA